MILPKILKTKENPLHIALSGGNITNWCNKYDKPLEEALSRHKKKLMEAIEYQIKKNIPILSLSLESNKEFIPTLVEFFKEIENSDDINENKVRIYVIGDWYSLDSELTDMIRIVTEKTKDYDSMFLNICLNYDGQKEILAGLRLLLKKAVAERYKIDDLNIEDIKENLASSYFIPPDLYIENGTTFSGLLLWDSKDKPIYFTNKFWLDFEISDFDKGINYFKESKKFLKSN